MTRWLALCAAIALGATAPPASAQAAQQQRPLAVIAPNGAHALPPIDLPRRGASGNGKRDLFAPHSWAPPVRVPTKPKPPPELHGPPEPPPPPPPPPLALTYLGQLDVEGAATVFYLAQGDRVHAVSLGDTVDGVYRLLAVEGRQLELLYVPLNVKQLLPLGPPS